MPKLPTKYVPAGTYIGELVSPSPTPVVSDNRTPVFIGKGSKYVKITDKLVRGRQYDVELVFTNSLPYRAVLPYHADGNQASSSLLANGSELRPDQWMFVDDGTGYLQIEVKSDVYDPTAQYTFTYTAVDRDAPDIIPHEDLRKIVRVGTTSQSPDFYEQNDFYINVDPSLNNENFTVTTSEYAVLDPEPTTNNGMIAISAGSSVTTDYTISWRVEFSNKVSGAGTYTIDVDLIMDFHSGGNPSNMDPDFYGEVLVAHTNITLNDSTALSDNTVTFSPWSGLTLEFTSGSSAGEFNDGDVWRLYALGTGKVEIEPTIFNTNTTPEIGTLTSSASNVGTASLSVSPISLYSHEYNALYVIKATNVTASDATFYAYRFSSIGMEAFGPFTVDGTDNTFTVDGITLEVTNPLSASANDLWFVEGIAPRTYITAKDSRHVEINITAAGNDAANDGYVTYTYLSDTSEGGWGTTTVRFSETGGQSVLSGGVVLWFRNLGAPSLDLIFTSNRYLTGDSFELDLDVDTYMRWDIQRVKDTSFTTDDIYMDLTGAITGTAGSRYVVLPYVPIEGTQVLAFTADGSWTAVLNPVENTPYAYFNPADVPTFDFRVRLYHWSNSPRAGANFYFTGHYVRPEELYNTPIKITNLEEGRKLLGPMDAGNDLYIMNEIAWRQSPSPKVMYIVQAKDTDGDGTYTDLDYETAIRACEQLAEANDIVLLNRPTSNALGATLRLLDFRNDPIVSLESLGWFGVSRDYSISDMVDLATKTFAVYGDSNSHGTRILVAPRYGVVTVPDENGTSVTLEVDGSFIAGAIAAMEGGFDDPGEDLLYKKIYGFDYIETFGDKFSPSNAELGKNGIIWLLTETEGVYKILEDTTVDKYANDYMQINNMTQKQWVTKNLRKALDLKVIGLVVNTPQDAELYIRGTVKSELEAYVANGVIAPYQDEAGRPRPISPEKDILVYPAPNSKTDYVFMYAFYLRNVIKRMFGYFVVDTNDFGIGRK